MFLKLIPFRFRETNSIKISWNFKSLKISTCAKSLFNISMLTERICSFHKKPRRFSLNCFIFWRNEDFAQKTCSNFVQCCKGERWSKCGEWSKTYLYPDKKFLPENIYVVPNALPCVDIPCNKCQKLLCFPLYRSLPGTITRARWILTWKSNALPASTSNRLA